LYTLKEISKILGQSCQIEDNDVCNWQLVYDSRMLSIPEQSIFFAIKTNDNNGHLFIDGLIKKGVRVFVVEKSEKINRQNGICYFEVENSIEALQTLASHHRQNFKIPIIGITGSNGKTIVKEFLNQILSYPERVCFSPKSFNSQIGVPISVWQFNEQH
jgi:alanine racemase